jgi:hypothetical protein
MRAYLLEMFLITAIFVGALAVPLVQANDTAEADAPLVQTAAPAALQTSLAAAPELAPAAVEVEEPIGQCICP